MWPQRGARGRAARRGNPNARRRPWVVLNMAMTADGKIASANRVLDTFGSARDLYRLYALRATADAVLCGATTVNGAGITLGNGGERHARERRRRQLAPAPLRVVVSGGGGLAPEAELFRSPGGRIVILTAARSGAVRRKAWEQAGAEVWVGGRARVDLARALEWLREEHGVRRLVCEGGAELNAGMFEAGLIDEIRVTVCPRVFGGRTAPTLADGEGVAHLADGVELRLVRARREGEEMFLSYRVVSRDAGRVRGRMA